MWAACCLALPVCPPDAAGSWSSWQQAGHFTSKQSYIHTALQCPHCWDSPHLSQA